MWGRPEGCGGGRRDRRSPGRRRYPSVHPSVGLSPCGLVTNIDTTVGRRVGVPLKSLRVCYSVEDEVCEIRDEPFYFRDIPGSSRSGTSGKGGEEGCGGGTGKDGEGWTPEDVVDHGDGPGLDETDRGRFVSPESSLRGGRDLMKGLGTGLHPVGVVKGRTAGRNEGSIYLYVNDYRRVGGLATEALSSRSRQTRWERRGHGS